jgi:hypothetical protein
MNNYIFSPNKNKPISEEAVVEYYTLSGNQDFDDDNQMPRTKAMSDLVYAKKSTNSEGLSRYFIRLSLSNKLYDPTSPYGLDKTKSFLDNTVRDADRFKAVNTKTFNLYLNFLKTKNTSYLHNAERESE